MRLWALAMVCAALAGCFGPDSSESDAGSQDAAAADGGSGTGGGSGIGGDGGSGGGVHPPDAQVAFDAGPARDGGGAPDLCNLPADAGDCDAAIPRWAWNPMIGGCEQFSYGGCGGNENNFQTPSECLQACANVGSTSGAACKVGGQVFPSGAGGIKDPHSCNTCQCLDGQLACTEIGCPEACPPNSAPSTSCAACGPADGCEILEHGCFVVCSDPSQCAGTEFGSCISGLCRNLCG